MSNPEFVEVDGKMLSLQQLLDEKKQLEAESAKLRKSYDKLEKEHTKAVLRRRQEQELKPYQAELIRMQQYLEDEVKRMIILLEGRDAAGKGGTIRRMTRYMNEKHYRVVALGKPTDVQKTQWFFQRYVEQFPTGGEVVIFDRSWYNRAMVEPVFNFCSPEQYENFMAGVTGFEKDIVREGTILLKLYFSVSKREQKYRFDRRRHDPLRHWKLSEVDMQAQDKWDEFTKMKYAMLRRTHTLDAPWIIIRSDNKHQARLNAIKTVLNAVPFKKTSGLDMTTDSNIVISGFRELEYMESERIAEGKFIT
ncbi:MAG: polyphosphate kinase 2 [Magnetococcales bacterium]|nr:polyphosphate kinase 2 [Magnetococcales bacterium]MBF0149664.1 polyphosphate kinase 2 [Magnetococcales bacterium]MBF0172510.1 polyphosphate kinase 2 [Magnetococcales bacterium]MBF0348853.1 polyphosphate kinase 2 [Magnetococcales bacterium]MBF0631807.1 polyphosphate kinase 2 [Magnetococcales bacterium]